MNRPNLATIMRRAHEIARECEGDYRSRITLGLRAAWAEAKAAEKIMEKKMTYEERLEADRMAAQAKRIAAALAAGEVEIKRAKNGKLVAEGPLNLASVGAKIDGHEVVGLGDYFRTYPNGRGSRHVERQYYYLDAPAAAPAKRPAALSVDEVGDLADSPIHDNTPYHMGDNYAE